MERRLSDWLVKECFEGLILMKISHVWPYARNLTLYFGASLIPMVLNLAINPLIAMNMTPEDYAINGYYTSFSSLISPVVLFYMLHYYNKR